MYPPALRSEMWTAPTRNSSKQFASPEEFKKRCAAAGLTEAAVRRMLEQQLYLSRFLDYRFRPAAQVDAKQIETYYNDEFVAAAEGAESNCSAAG